jgi:hypothetical protein
MYLTEILYDDEYSDNIYRYCDMTAECRNSEAVVAGQRVRTSNTLPS